MTQEEKVMLIHHDHSLDMLSTAITTTNTKLDKVIEALTNQNVIAEKQSNMDKNTAEAFGRVYKELDAIKTHQERIELVLDDNVKSSSARWFLVIIIGYAVTFGTYVVTGINYNDKRIEAGRQVVESRLDHIERGIK